MLRCSPAPLRKSECSKPAHSSTTRVPSSSSSSRGLLQCTYAPMHPCTHAPMHPCTHAPMHPCTHAPTHPCTHAPMHPCAHAPMHPCTHAPMRPCTHAPMHPCTHAPVRPCTQARAAAALEGHEAALGAAVRAAVAAHETEGGCSLPLRPVRGPLPRFAEPRATPRTAPGQAHGWPGYKLHLGHARFGAAGPGQVRRGWAVVPRGAGGEARDA